MFKKLLTLAAVAVMAYTAKAETVEAYYCDYANETAWSGWVMGYIPEVINGELVAKAPTIEYVEINDENTEKYGDVWDAWENITINGADNKIRPLDEPVGWYQFFLSKGQVGGKKGMMHFITVNCYAPELADGEEINVTLQCRWSWSEDPINVVLPVTNKKEDVTVVCNGPAADNFDIIYQLGGYVGEVHIASVKVVYENIVIEQEFENIIANGDASADWENPALTINDEGWQYISVWGKEAKSEPHPANIETVDGDRVFVVHATAMESDPWDNQLWICAPREFNQGDEFKVSFRLKATAEAAPGSQAHKSPSNYLHWACIGNPSFKTDWSNFAKEVTVDGNMSGMWSIALNLNDYEPANDYYIDDVKWEIAKILEGWFIATDAVANGLLGAAVEMGYDEEEGAWYAVVGTEENPASWVKISTQKGSDSAFKGSSLGIEADETEAGEYYDYTVKNGAQIELPYPGVWKVYVYEEYQMVAFEEAEEGGVMDINAEIAAPVYYNLQGVRVDNPSKGIFVVKRGNKVSKQVIR